MNSQTKETGQWKEFRTLKAYNNMNIPPEIMKDNKK